MMRGVSDEYALGMSYGAIDLALDNLSARVSREDLISAGVTEEEIRRVKEMKELSGWKRRSMTVPFPLDGSRSGGLRVG
jgi:NH3-dependent NAD+ synthetase